MMVDALSGRLFLAKINVVDRNKLNRARQTTAELNT